jgi:MFS family permease
MMGAAAPLIGRMVDRHGARKVIATGGLIGGLGYASLNPMTSIWQFYSSYAAIGIGMSAIMSIPSSAVVSNWFEKRRGLAIGIMSTGVGVGGLTLAPLIGGYFIPHFGWRASYLVLAGFMVLVIPVALLVIKTKPADMGLYPDGRKSPESVATNEVLLPPSTGSTLKMALVTSTFWLIVICFLIGGFSRIGLMQNQVPYMEDIGFPVATAAATLGIVGLGSAIGKFVFGWLCDRIPAKYAGAIGLGLHAVSIVMLINIDPTTPLIVIWLYSLIMGIGVGGWLPTLSMLISTNFGLASYGTIFGMAILIHNIGTATGPLMAGYMYDTMNTYHWAFIIFLALYAIAIPAILLLRRPKSI